MCLKCLRLKGVARNFSPPPGRFSPPLDNYSAPPFGRNPENAPALYANLDNVVKPRDSAKKLQLFHQYSQNSEKRVIMI